MAHGLYFESFWEIFHIETIPSFSIWTSCGRNKIHFPKWLTCLNSSWLWPSSVLFPHSQKWPPFSPTFSKVRRREAVMWASSFKFKCQLLRIWEPLALPFTHTHTHKSAHNNLTCCSNEIECMDVSRGQPGTWQDSPDMLFTHLRPSPMDPCTCCHLLGRWASLRKGPGATAGVHPGLV